MKNIYSFFSEGLKKSPNTAALVVDGIEYSYLEIDDMVNDLVLNHLLTDDQNIGIYASRSISAYIFLLATLKSGKTYIPLNPKFPFERNKSIIDQAGIKFILCEERFSSEVKISLGDLLNEIELVSVSPVKTNEKYEFRMVSVEPSKYCYILFTSGSTGTPKGVPISHKNVFSYIDYQFNRYRNTSNDRFSQSFDLTFDLSVHDLFLCWKGGSTLYIIPEKQLMFPAKFIKENRLTFWFSVPSLAQSLMALRLLKPESFPTLKYSLFCGEPLTLDLAKAWQEAAPNSIVENIYGPTEATIGITHYRCPKNIDEIKHLNGVISIGRVFDSQKFLILNDEIESKEGELCVSGTQIFDGYWKNPEKTSEVFHLDDDVKYYKTGDLVRLESTGEIQYVGRKDNQVKINGFRVELEEINYALSCLVEKSIVVSIPITNSLGLNTGIRSFICTPSQTKEEEMIGQLKNVLPSYMVPKEIIRIEEFPKNSNGKIDKLALSQL